MYRFITRRLVTSVLSLIAVTFIVFGLSRVYGDPIALFVPHEGYGLTQQQRDEAIHRLHLDRPLPVQYAYWMADLLRGDLGTDLSDRRPVRPKLAQKMFPTLRLAGTSWALATMFGITLGVVSGVARGSLWDYAGRVIAVLGQSLPSFWIGIVAILLFAVWLKWLPAGTMGEGIAIRNHILPVAILAWLPMSGYVRLTRSAMLEVMDSEYIKFARAKGVSWALVVWKHGLKNALIAPLTYGGLWLAGLITGSIAVETVFAWPGVARWGVEAVWNNNFPVLAVVTLVFSFGFVVLNFVVDVLYAAIDPRVRYS